MKTFPKFWQKLTPIQSLVLGFALVTFLGAFLLTLPISSVKGIRQPYIDALFVATSGISTTGLTPVDIGSYYSFFGQLVVLFLVQIGGLGYMVFILLIAYVFGHRPSLYTRVAFRESLAGISLGDMKQMTKVVLLFTFFFELLGTIILSSYWLRDYPPSKAIWLGIFHSISGFCTAGFGLFSDSLESIKYNVVVNITIIIICLAGAVGFFVLYDLFLAVQKITRSKNPFKNLSVHSKVVLFTTSVIIATGVFLLLILENWPASTSWGQRLLFSFFQSNSASTTTGYNSINIGALSAPSLVVLIILMFIGASPGSTGGGIKTTTFGIVFLSIWSLLKGRENINVFKRRLPRDTVDRAFTIFIMALTLVIVDVVIMTITEKSYFLPILFEIVSGFGNVGLSTGITSSLSIIGKLLITITMFIGRVGPMSIGFSLIGRVVKGSYRYPVATIFVG